MAAADREIARHYTLISELLERVARLERENAELHQRMMVYKKAKRGPFAPKKKPRTRAGNAPVQPRFRARPAPS